MGKSKHTAADKARISFWKQTYYQRNRAKKKVYSATYYYKNQKQKQATSLKYYYNNQKQRQAYDAKSYNKNPEKAKARSIKFYQNNKVLVIKRSNAQAIKTKKLLQIHKANGTLQKYLREKYRDKSNQISVRRLKKTWPQERLHYGTRTKLLPNKKSKPVQLQWFENPEPIPM